jgi:hypothetical protein
MHLLYAFDISDLSSFFAKKVRFLRASNMDMNIMRDSRGYFSVTQIFLYVNGTLLNSNNELFSNCSDAIQSTVASISSNSVASEDVTVREFVSGIKRTAGLN